MSKMFYHVMQDNAGNLLFDVAGTMRIAGTGTLATIYGDEALTVPIPNPMTNHPSFGSFKCFLGVGDYDFYLAKSGYSFETLTGVQGSGTMADQNASNVTITGGNATLSQATATRFTSPDEVGEFQTAYEGNKSVGTNRWNLYMNGTAWNYLNGPLTIAGQTPLTNARVSIRWQHAAPGGITLQVTDSDTGAFGALSFANVAGTTVGSITQTAAATAYNTTSDMRLKEAIEPLRGALDVVRALNPVSFLWKADDSPGRGLLAHEVAEVVDGVITGEKDAVDEDGNIQPQMIDYSKLVPYLVGAVKELTQQVEMLTAQLAAVGA